MKSLILILSFLISCNIFAGNKCVVEAEISIFNYDDTLYETGPLEGIKYMDSFDSWEDCYEFAIEKAHGLRTKLPLTVSGFLVEGGSAKTDGLISVKWKFNDSYLFDSKGKVTKFTDEFLSDPLKGDARYREDGSLFE